MEKMNLKAALNEIHDLCSCVFNSPRGSKILSSIFNSIRSIILENSFVNISSSDSDKIWKKIFSSLIWIGRCLLPKIWPIKTRASSKLASVLCFFVTEMTFSGFCWMKMNFSWSDNNTSPFWILESESRTMPRSVPLFVIALSLF